MIYNRKIFLQIYKTQYTGGSKLKFVDKEIVLVEKHTKCKCDCRLQPEVSRYLILSLCKPSTAPKQSRYQSSYDYHNYGGGK